MHSGFASQPPFEGVSTWLRRTHHTFTGVQATELLISQQVCLSLPNSFTISLRTNQPCSVTATLVPLLAVKCLLNCQLLGALTIDCLQMVKVAMEHLHRMVAHNQVPRGSGLMEGHLQRNPSILGTELQGLHLMDKCGSSSLPNGPILDLYLAICAFSTVLPW